MFCVDIRYNGSMTRSIRVYSAPWYPGHALLERSIGIVQEKVGDDFPVVLVNVDEDIVDAENQKVVTIPTAILFQGEDSKRRVSGAIGIPEILGLAGVKSRARVIPKK